MSSLLAHAKCAPLLMLLLSGCVASPLQAISEGTNALSGPWACDAPVEGYFAATRASLSTVENSLIGPPWATFYAPGASIILNPDVPGEVHSLLFQARSCSFPSFTEQECSAALGVNGKIGPIQSDPDLAVNFVVGERGWCGETAQFPLRFAGILAITLGGQTLAVRAVDLGPRNESPGFADGRLVKVGVLQLTIAKVADDCTYQDLPCDGEIVGTAKAVRMSGYPDDFEPAAVDSTP